MTKDRPVKEDDRCAYIDHISDMKVIIVTTYFIHYIANFFSPQMTQLMELFSTILFFGSV